MKKFLFIHSVKGKLSSLLFIIMFLLSISSCAAFGESSFTSAAISFLNNTNLSIPDEARNILLSCISSDKTSTGWVIESNSVIYALEVDAIPRAKVSTSQNSINKAAMRRSLTRATLRLAVYLDNGKLNRKYFSHKEAADYALLMSYSGRIKGGIQSYSRESGTYAVSLVWVNREALQNTGQTQTQDQRQYEAQILNDYSRYLYKQAHDLFKSGNFAEALKTFHQIHYMSWANTSAYLGAS